jgi:hypothetical protein
MWQHAMQDPDNHPGLWPILKYMATGDQSYKTDLQKQLNQRGLIAIGTRARHPGGTVPGFNTAPIIAHEAGHAKIEREGGPLQFLQRYPYHYDALLAPLAGAGGFAAGLYSGGPIRGALAGALTGGLVQAGKVVPEMMASHYGLKGLKSFEGGAFTKSTDRQRLMAALLTYLATTVAVPTLAGAAGGWISGRRKKKTEQEAKLDSEQFS